ncbi:MAG: hypothetical protein EBZ59_02575 [Planctomycetia bacterium]|nr:hypothetical protein [Planctomycetia bacterium]
MILFQQRYTSPNPGRQRELEHVRAVNEAAPVFSEVVHVDGGERRWTFADFFRLAEARFPGRLCVLANSDIAFDDSLAAAGPLAERGALVALSRWDDSCSPSMEGRVEGNGWHFYSHSQDAWVFRAGGLPPFAAEFQLGVPQCESRLAYEAAAAGTVVVNPALSVRCLHHHASAVRTWARRDRYRGPLLFPRLTTVDAVDPEGFVLERSGRLRKIAAVVRLTGSAADFHGQIAGKSPVFGLNSMRIGLRSPFYVRRRP